MTSMMIRQLKQESIIYVIAILLLGNKIPHILPRREISRRLFTRALKHLTHVDPSILKEHNIRKNIILMYTVNALKCRKDIKYNPL